MRPSTNATEMRLFPPPIPRIHWQVSTPAGIWRRICRHPLPDRCLHYNYVQHLIIGGDGYDDFGNGRYRWWK
jgi:hypothetical protein